MKKLVCLLILGITLTACGCGEGKGEVTQESGIETNENAASSFAAAFAVSERSWEEKALITLGSTVTIDGTGAEVRENVIVISEGGSYEVTGTMSDGLLYVETDDAVRLYLNNASITSSTGPAIYVENAEEVWIETAEGTENVLTDAATYQGVFAEKNVDTDSEDEVGKGTFFSNDDLIFTGNGLLIVNGNYRHGICSDDSIYFQGGSYELAAVKDGVHANDAIVVNQGDIEVTEGHDGMESEGIITMNGGSYTASVVDDGMSAAGNLTINDGVITVAACEEGLESKAELYVNGGTITITGNDDGLNGGTLVQINDGILYINMQAGDGLDSNGRLEINGGIILALGGNAPEGGADCDENTFIITGGTLIATGGVNSAPTEDKCTQAAVLLGSAAAGDTIGIRDAQGNTVFAYEVTKSYENLLLSGEFLKEGESYTVYTGGTISGAENTYGYDAKAEYEGGAESISFTVDSMLISAGGTAGMQGGRGGRFPGGMQDGQFPGGMDGQMPEGMEDGRMPKGMENGRFPGGGRDGQFRKGMDGQMPEGMEDGQFPGGSMNGQNVPLQVQVDQK